MRRIAIAVASILMPGVVLTSTARVGPANAAETEPERRQRVIDASEARLEARQLIVDVNTSKAGWVVIHKTKNEEVGKHIGHAKVGVGANNDVRIALTEQVKPGEELIIMLHKDAGADGKFEFGPGNDTDAPVTENGQPVTVTVTPR